MRYAPTLVRARGLSMAQIEAIRAAMHLFIEDDLAHGLAHTARTFCDACQQSRSLLGAIHYGRYQICNKCATEYEVARARGQVVTAGQFVRDKQFGDAELYALPPTPREPTPSRPVHERARSRSARRSA